MTSAKVITVDRIEFRRAEPVTIAPRRKPVHCLPQPSPGIFRNCSLNCFLKWDRHRPGPSLKPAPGEASSRTASSTAFRAHYPEVFSATSYVIDEVSPATRRRAAERLSEFAERLTFQRLDEIDNPATAGVVFSNELIDAFPVHRVIMRNGRLRELCVGLGPGRFRLGRT